MKVVQFCEAGDGTYEDFSNFSDHPVMIDGKLWPTTEHYFQAMKTLDAKEQEKIRSLATPGESFAAGRGLQLRSDWEGVKDAVMLKAVWAKFTQYEKLKELLLSTGGAYINQAKQHDRYWGDGENGDGVNMLGHILMMVREFIREGKVIA